MSTTSFLPVTTRPVVDSNPPAGQADAIRLAALLKAAADPLRLQLLRVLSGNAFGALELSNIFDMRQNAMSHHLKLLSKAMLVSSRREGTHIFYRRHNHQPPLPLCEAILAAADQLELPGVLQGRLNAVQEARAAASREFFRHNAAKFREQQDLIASFPQYGEAVLTTLDGLGDDHRRLVVEVGPGEGDLLPGLHRRFAQVLALDNSSEMLERARSYACKAGLDDIRFVLGDTASPELETVCADAITLNMVLHHTPAPASIVSELAQRLAPGGVLVITELCSHDQDWVRQACGDLWLGFDADELGRWGLQAGLEDIGSEFLALKNGFSIQIRQFRLSATSTGVN